MASVRRQSQTRPEALAPEVIDVLIHGWENHPAWSRHSPTIWSALMLTHEELEALAMQHRGWLRDEAARRGVGQPAFLEPDEEP